MVKQAGDAGKPSPAQPKTPADAGTDPKVTKPGEKDAASKQPTGGEPNTRSVKLQLKLVYIEKPYAVWRSQNAGREHAVPLNVLDRLLTKLEPPTPGEAHEVVYLVDSLTRWRL